MVEDAAMPDAAINGTSEILFSEAALSWLQANQDKLEDMAQKRQKMWNIADWEESETWSNKQSEKLDEAKAKIGSMQRELQKMEKERTQMIAERAQERSQMIAHIRGLEQQRAGIAGFRIFFTLRPGSRTSMLAICQMLFF